MAHSRACDNRLTYSIPNLTKLSYPAGDFYDIHSYNVYHKKNASISACHFFQIL